MISGIDLNAVVDFTLKEDKDNPTVWKLGCLPSSVMAQLASDASKGDYMKQMLDLVKKGVKGWDNCSIKYIVDDAGLTQETLDQIPLNVIIELGTEILKINKLSGEEVKN